MAVIKDFSANYMKALGLNQAYMLLELRNKYYIELILINNGKYITAINKKSLKKIFIWITRMIFD